MAKTNIPADAVNSFKRFINILLIRFNIFKIISKFILAKNFYYDATRSQLPHY